VTVVAILSQISIAEVYAECNQNNTTKVNMHP